MRIHGKVDKIQKEVVSALRKAGAHVAITSDLGCGYPDIVVGFRGSLLWMEIKSPGGRLTQDEKEFYSEWLQYMVVVYSIDDALRAIGAI